MFNIDEFIARTESKRYFVKTNKFKAVIPLCAGLLGSGTQNEIGSGSNSYRYMDIARDLEFWCNISAIPGVTLGTYEGARYTYGGREKRPIAPIFQDIIFSFYGDGESKNLRFFTDWINLINNFDLTTTGINQSKYSSNGNSIYPYELTYKYEYAVPINLYVYEDSGIVSHQIELRDAFPIMVSDIRLNWQDTGLMQVTVLMTYTDWVRKFDNQVVSTTTPPGTGGPEPFPGQQRTGGGEPAPFQIIKGF